MRAPEPRAGGAAGRGAPGGDPRARLAVNQATVQRWGALDAIEGCARHGIGFVGLWRDKVAEAGADAVRRRLAATGVRASSLCRGGFFTAATAAERRARVDDNRRALDEAAAVGADLLVLVGGGVVGRDLAGSRAMVEEAIAELLPDAEACGVCLGVEPLHPMFAADRSVVASLAQALGIVGRVVARSGRERAAPTAGRPSVGVVVDAYHLWWEEDVHTRIEAAGAAVVAFHVNDWIVPLPDVLLGRGMMGDGVIDLRALRRAVDGAGYAGPIEVEVFQQALWDAPGDDVLALLIERFEACVLG